MADLIPYSDFFRGVRMYVDTAPRPIIEEALRSTAIEFCDDSDYIRRTLPCLIRLRTGEATYNFPDLAEPDETIAKIVELQIKPRDSTENTIDLKIRDREYLDEMRSGWRDSDPSVPEFAILDKESNTFNITLSPPPDSTVAGREVTGIISVKPTRDSTSVDASLHADYYDCLVSGAAYRLMSMAGKPWSATDNVRWHLSVYQDGLREARRRRKHSFSTSQKRAFIRVHPYQKSSRLSRNDANFDTD